MNEGQRVGMFRALQLFFGHFADFSGRSRRSEYWWMFLWSTLCSVAFLGVIIAILVTVGLRPGWQDTGMLGVMMVFIGAAVFFALVLLVPWVALTVRRYRDAGVSPWWLLLTMLAAQILTSADKLVAGSMGNTLVLIGALLTVINLVICVLKRRPEEG